jgi:hypothetical protein
MPPALCRVGQAVRAIRDIPLVRNTHVQIISAAGPTMLRKDTEGEITLITSQHIELNCKDGHLPVMCSKNVTALITPKPWEQSRFRRRSYPRVTVLLSL